MNNLFDLHTARTEFAPDMRVSMVDELYSLQLLRKYNIPLLDKPNHLDYTVFVD